MNTDRLSIAQHLEIVEERITKACQNVGRKRSDVQLLAVTKTMPPEVLREAYGLGLHSFGESYVQELRPKFDMLEDLDISWHFIGQLQSNKAKFLNKCTMVHSLDSLSAAQELSRHAVDKQRVLVEINCGEEQKGGVSPEAAADFIRQIRDLPNLVVSGLMTVAPLWAEGAEAGQFFALLAKLRDNISAELQLGPEFKELSMGMSGDFEYAIAAGATWIRLGSILFGQRSVARWWQTSENVEGKK